MRVRVWDVSRRSLLADISLPTPYGSSVLRFTPDSATLVFVYDDRSVGYDRVRLWDVATKSDAAD
jgi:hypothetical protein